MIYTEFRDKYKGKFVEMGGSTNALNQCVDLVNAYIAEVLNQPIILGTNAQDFPSKMPNYERIDNSPTGVPKQGDIIVWSSPDKIGHIGICDSANIDNFVSFDQNWPLQSPCKLVSHTYTGTTYNVLCWMRLKVNEEPIMTEEQKRILAFIGGRTEGEVREAFGALADQPNLIKQIVDLKSSQENLNSQITELNVKLAISEKMAADYQSALKAANITGQKLSADLDYYQPYKALYEKALKNTIDKYTAWQLIRMGINLLIQKSK